MPLALKQFQRAHDHAWGAETALQGVMVAKRRQQRVLRMAGLAQALDRVNRRAVRLDGQDRARLHSVAVQAHRARAALGRIASDMRTSNAEFLAQKVNEQLPGLDLGPPLFTVHRDGDVMT
jgi:DNA repair ATPase RecN